MAMARHAHCDRISAWTAVVWHIHYGGLYISTLEDNTLVTIGGRVGADCLDCLPLFADVQNTYDESNL